jgi:type IX secretion system PorP/SprF family membrane protein
MSLCRKIFHCLLFLLSTAGFSGIWAQQEVQYSLFSLNPFGYNPAYAGLEESLVANAVIRKQWAGLNGSPFSQQLNVHLPWYYLKGGVGFRLENDQIGAHRTTTYALAYDYWLPMGKSGIISVGIEAGMQQLALNGALLRTPGGDYEDGAIQHNDNILPVGLVSGKVPVVSAGICFQNQNWEFGLSVRNITAQEIKFTENSFAGIAFNRNYFFNFATTFKAGRILTFKPALLLKSDILQTQLDAGTLVDYNDQFFAGIFYRGFNQKTTDAFVLSSGLKLNSKWTLVYAFDLTLSPLRAVNQGSHEIMLLYNLNKDIGKGRLPGIIYNSRYL